MEGENPETNGHSAPPEKPAEAIDPPEALINIPSNAPPLSPSSPSKQPTSPSKLKDGVTGTKVKRKTRRKLNAMVSNASLYFSDTDSEGELTTITPAGRISRHLSDVPHQAPMISVTAEEKDDEDTQPGDKDDALDDNCKDTLQCNNFVESLTDVDEIYASETENEIRENSASSLNVAENCCTGETDLEDFEADEEVQATIFVKPRSDIFCEYSGETITTKEGDGPFSVEVRNRIYLEEAPRRQAHSNTPEITVLINTDEEDMTISDEELMEEACFNQKEVFEDLDVITASQIVMKNVNKTDNLLNVKEASDEAISDCHTDVEDVEQVE